MAKKQKIPTFKILSLVFELFTFVVQEIKKHVDPDSPDGMKITKEEGEKLGKSVGVKATALILDLLEDL